MKKINKIVRFLLVVFLVIFVSCSIAISLFGKNFVVSQAEKNLKMKMSLGSIGLRLPFSVVLKGLELEGLFKAQEISFYPNILGLLGGKIVLSGVTLVRPVINIEQSKSGVLNVPVFEKTGKQKQPPVLLTGLAVKDGRFIFTDKKIAPEGYKVIADKINVSFSKVMFPPASLNTRFKMDFSFVDTQDKALGDVDFSGWIDFGSKDMDASLKIGNVDLTYFTPYYGDFISKKKLLSLKLNSLSFFKAERNNLKVSSNFKLSDLAYAEEEQQEGESLDIFGNTLAVFADKNGNLDLNFEINTKLDTPKVTLEDLKGIILAAAIRNLSNRSPSEIADKVGRDIKQFRDFGEGLRDIFKKKKED